MARQGRAELDSQTRSNTLSWLRRIALGSSHTCLEYLTTRAAGNREVTIGLSNWHEIGRGKELHGATWELMRAFRVAEEKGVVLMLGVAAVIAAARPVAFVVPFRSTASSVPPTNCSSSAADCAMSQPHQALCAFSGIPHLHCHYHGLNGLPTGQQGVSVPRR